MADESQDLPENFGLIVEKLAPELGPLGGAPHPLDGGITNRNYLVRLGGGRYVIRVPGKDTSLLGINREAERAANELAAELGIAPRVAAFLTDPACIVTEFAEGRGMTEEELRDQDRVTEVAAILRRLHDSDHGIASEFDSFAIVDSYAAVATERGAKLPPGFAAAREWAANVEAKLDAAEHAPVPCHNDLLAGNFICGARGMVIVDWEYAGMGSRYFDLANFAVNNGLDESGRAALLDAYWEGSAPTRAQDDLRRMAVMSDFREAMWGVVQATVSDLDFDFGAYAAKHFARMAAGMEPNAEV